MPTVSGPLDDVTGSPTTAREVWLRAPDLRIGDGDGLTTTEQHRIPVIAGNVTFECQPGPAVMVILHTGGVPEKLNLMVRDVDVSLARAAEDAADYPEPVVSKVTGERIAAEAAADRAETAADDVDASIAGAADRVVQAVEVDRVAAEQARGGAEDARDAAALSEAESTRQAGLAADHAGDADASRRAAGLSETNAGLSEEAAAGHEAQALAARDDARTYRDESRTARDGSVSAASQSETARDEAAGSTAAASGHAVTAGTKAEQAALSAQTAEQIAQQVIDALANARAYQDVVTAIGGMSADWHQDIADAIAALVGQAPETLNTIEEVAQALGNDPNFFTTIMDAIGRRVKNDDPRLSDARTPTTHQHGLVDLPAVVAAFDEKSDKGHSHAWSQISEKPSNYPPTAHQHTKAEVGLGNADNTSDENKPVSTATQQALNAKASTSLVESRPAMWLWSGTGTWSPPAAANNGDSVLNLDSGEIHSITEV